MPPPLVRHLLVEELVGLVEADGHLPGAGLLDALHVAEEAADRTVLGSMLRCRLKTTSAAVTGWPSQKCASWRIVVDHVSGLGYVHDRRSRGRSSSRASNEQRIVQMRAHETGAVVGRFERIERGRLAIRKVPRDLGNRVRAGGSRVLEGEALVVALVDDVEDVDPQAARVPAHSSNRAPTTKTTAAEEVCSPGASWPLLTHVPMSPSP